MQIEQFQANQIIYSVNDQSEKFYLVYWGEVSIQAPEQVQSFANLSINLSPTKQHASEKIDLQRLDI